LKRHFFSKPNADIRHLLDSLVSALAVYATAFTSKLYLLASGPHTTRVTSATRIQESVHSSAKWVFVPTTMVLFFSDECASLFVERTPTSIVLLFWPVEAKIPKTISIDLHLLHLLETIFPLERNLPVLDKTQPVEEARPCHALKVLVLFFDKSAATT